MKKLLSVPDSIKSGLKNIIGTSSKTSQGLEMIPYKAPLENEVLELQIKPILEVIHGTLAVALTRQLALRTTPSKIKKIKSEEPETGTSVTLFILTLEQS